MRNRMMQLRDEAYAQFQRKLLPTLEGEKIIGVRTPLLRAMAKEMLEGGEAEGFMQHLPHDTFEENQLHAFLISECRDFDKVIRHLQAFLPYVDNWATCDQLRPKAFKKEKERLLLYIWEWMHAQQAYTIRFGMEMLMCHYMEEAFDDQHLAWVADVKHEDYYVRMMVAWYFATALTRQYDAALPYMKEKRLERWTHNKAIQKAIESRCILDERKAYLRKLKITEENG